MKNDNYQWQTERRDETAAMGEAQALAKVGQWDEQFQAKKVPLSWIEEFNEKWIEFAESRGLPHQGFKDEGLRYGAKLRQQEVAGAADINLAHLPHPDETLYDPELNQIDREIIGMTDDDDHIEENVLEVDFGYGSDVNDVSA